MDITEPRQLRALAHPLRLDLIETLGARGPSTAAQCARELGETQASCSFHLRQLAKYGYVEEAPPGSDRRERMWRLTDVEQKWSSESPGAADMERVFVQREADKMVRWSASSDGEPAEWREAAFLGGASLPLTADELEQVRDQLRAVIEPFVERLRDPSLRPPDSRVVRVFLSGTPAPGSKNGEQE